MSQKNMTTTRVISIFGVPVLEWGLTDSYFIISLHIHGLVSFGIYWWVGDE